MSDGSSGSTTEGQSNEGSIGSNSQVFFKIDWNFF